MLTLLVGGWIAVTVMLLSADDAWPHAAGPLMPPGVTGAVQAQAIPHPNTPNSQEDNQPLGWKYGWECCSGMDCAEMKDDAVHETPEGYQIDGANDAAPISYTDPRRIKQSKDEHFHWCAHRSGPDKNKTICLYVPPKGY